MPVIAFYVPLYAFWHFDDFSWGNTRLVTGEDGKKVAVIDAVPVSKVFVILISYIFDISFIDFLYLSFFL